MLWWNAPLGNFLARLWWRFSAAYWDARAPPWPSNTAKYESRDLCDIQIHHSASARQHTHTRTRWGFFGRCLTALTLVGAEWPNSCSCRAEAHERPASPPARHASPPRSPSTQGDLETQHLLVSPQATVPTAIKSHSLRVTGREKSKQTLWQKSWKPSLQTFLISSSPGLPSHTSSSRFRFNLPSSSSFFEKDFKAVGTWAIWKPKQGTTSSLPPSI